MTPLALLGGILVNRYTLFLAGLGLYLLATHPLIEMTHGIERMEIPLLLYLYYCLNAFARESKWRAVTAALPLVILYLVHDYYFMRFFRIPKINDLTQVPELFSVTGWEVNLTLACVALLLLYLLFTRFHVTRKGLLLAMPAVLVLGGPMLHPASFIQVYSTLSREVIHYATVVNVEYNGRLVTALYNEARRRDTMSHIAQYRDIEKLAMRLPADLEKPDKTNGRNVHLIVLEGFLDPTLLANLPASLQPLHPDFLEALSPHLGFSISPVFGGYTAQAEFEVLCGVPAFQEFDEIEFNVFSGSPTYCLPAILGRLGYRTAASNAFKPDFFNAMPAYRGLGFEAIYFAKEYTPSMETYLAKGEGVENKYFYDTELFTQNLAFVERMLADKKPFFNYLLTVYGHFPFEYGSRMGPPRYPAPALPWDLERIINQLHYRSKAVSDYVRQLRALDPEALIILVSDHLPPLEGGVNVYGKFGYLREGLEERFYRNRLLIFRNGHPEKKENFYHFNIYRTILDHVTAGEYCKNRPCDFRFPFDKETLRDDYHIIMGLASKGLNL
ncbi:MAG: LTA synthase family protein [Magnetococcales bacterium]|nr:LTA synthase family protein [Magnetococcales bacterium]